jgi:hypothetical protein
MSVIPTVKLFKGDDYMIVNACDAERHAQDGWKPEAAPEAKPEKKPKAAKKPE